VTVNVTRAAPAITWANPAAVIYGTALSGTQLNATANVAGSFSYSPANGVVLPAGANQLTATFTPTDTTDYTTAAAAVTVNVTRAAPAITWANPAAVIYGTALSGTQLNATANVAGSFSYNPANGVVLRAGANQLTATFTPTDTTDYTTTTAAVTVNVTQATPAITWANPAAVIYGTALSGTQLNATANVAGSFSYHPANGVVPRAGANHLTATFTPADTNDYAIVKAIATINVQQAPLTITANNASKVHGAALPALTASYSGFVNGDTPASLTKPVTLGTTATTNSPVGLYTITASSAVSPNYAITYVAGTLTITPSVATDAKGVVQIRPAKELSYLSKSAATDVPGVVQVAAINSPQPAVAVNFPVVPGHTYAVQASTDLKNWETICQTTPTSDGWVQFQDPIAANVPMRFYRTVSN
jgi:arginine exporter protein ArgO